MSILNNLWWHMSGMFEAFCLMNEYDMACDVQAIRIVIGKIEHGDLPLEYAKSYED